MRTSIAWLALGIAACTPSPNRGNETASVAGSVSQTSALVGPRWRLVELEGQPSIAGGGAREAHIVFSRSDDVNRVGGATGCNSMGGTYEVDGDRIRFVDLFSTKMACVEEDRMRQEARFLGALQLADRYAISGDTLTLTAAGDEVAKFVK